MERTCPAFDNKVCFTPSSDSYGLKVTYCYNCKCYPTCVACSGTLVETRNTLCTACSNKGLNVCESCDRTSDVLFREGDYLLCVYCRTGATTDANTMAYTTGSCKVCRSKSNRIIDGVCPLHYYQNRWANDAHHRGHCRNCNELMELNHVGKCSRCYVQTKLTLSRPKLDIPARSSVCGCCRKLKPNPEPTCWDCAHTCVECGTQFIGLEREDKLCLNCFQEFNAKAACRVCGKDRGRSWHNELAVCSEECKAYLFSGHKFMCTYCSEVEVRAPYELCGKCEELTILCPSCQVTVIGINDYVCLKCLRINETRYSTQRQKSESAT